MLPWNIRHGVFGDLFQSTRWVREVRHSQQGSVWQGLPCLPGRPEGGGLGGSSGAREYDEHNNCWQEMDGPISAEEDGLRACRGVVLHKL